MTLEHASRFICTSFMVLVVGAFAAPVDALILNDAQHHFHYPWFGILMFVGPMIIGASALISVIPRADLGREIASIVYPLTGAVLSFFISAGSGVVAPVVLGLAWGQAAVVAHNHSQALLGRWLNKVRCDAEFRLWMYGLVAGAFAVATLYVFWYPWVQNGYVVSTFLEALLVDTQLAAVGAAAVCVLNAHCRGEGLIQLRSVALAALVVATTWIVMPRIILSNAGSAYSYWHTIQSGELTFFTALWTLSIVAGAVFYVIETSLESGVLTSPKATASASTALSS